MNTVVSIAVIFVVGLLIATIMMQIRGSSAGLFGGGGATFRTRRGVEKTLFQLTIVLAFVFVMLSILNAWRPWDR